MIDIDINEYKKLAYATSQYKYNTRFIIFDKSTNAILCTYVLYLRIHDNLFSCDFVLMKETATTKDNIKVFNVTENIIPEVINYIILTEHGI